MGIGLFKSLLVVAHTPPPGSFRARPSRLKEFEEIWSFFRCMRRVLALCREQHLLYNPHPSKAEREEIRNGGLVSLQFTHWLMAAAAASLLARDIQVIPIHHEAPLRFYYFAVFFLSSFSFLFLMMIRTRS
jgi:hypothetical protein